MLDVANKSKKIVVGTDHYGLHVKKVARDYLRSLGYKVDDLGMQAETTADYPDIGATVADAVGAAKYYRGVLVYSTGAGLK